MDMLVVKEVRGLHEALVTQIAFERPVSRVFMSTSVTHQSILLLEAHLTLVTVVGTLLRVCALMLAKVRRSLKTLTTCGTAEWSRTLWVAGVMQQL